LLNCTSGYIVKKTLYSERLRLSQIYREQAMISLSPAIVSIYGVGENH